MIDKSELSADIRTFVLATIPTIPHLEALMLLRATAPQPWTPERLSGRLYVTHEAAEAVLADLRSAGMLRDGDAGCHYAAGALCELIDRLAECYAARLVELTLLIHSGRR